jgi:hypothetical protein
MVVYQYRNFDSYSLTSLDKQFTSIFVFFHERPGGGSKQKGVDLFANDTPVFYAFFTKL